jgi:small-conductance mechanosensitive channel/CRP-like cAMP-binding protein
MAALNAFLAGDLAGAESLGVLIAVGLLVALRIARRGHVDAGLRAPVALLVAHAVVFALDQALEANARLHRALAPLAIVLLFTSIARSVVILVLDVAIGPRLSRPLPRIFREMVHGLVYVGVAMLALHQAGVEPSSLLTTSALLTAVVGLSLQETLGNLFAGLAIQLQAPFEVGDWIQFDADSKHIGRVVEINWRATKVITLDEVEVVVPNAGLAKAPITNFTKPTLVSRRSVYVAAPYNVPPLEVHKAILDAIADSPGVVPEPRPSVVTNLFGEYGIEYWVRFYTDRFHQRDGVDGGVRDRIWYALRRAGVEIPYPHRTLEVHQVTEESTVRDGERQRAARNAALRGVDIFRVLSDVELGLLADHAERRLYAPGEVVVRQGDDTSELYLIERGEVTVHMKRPGATGSVELARLGAGKFFGEMALVTGDKRQASVTAATGCQFLCVGRAALEPILAQAPHLADRIGAVLVERQAELDLHTLAPEDRAGQESVEKQDLVKRIRKFFAL